MILAFGLFTHTMMHLPFLSEKDQSFFLRFVIWKGASGLSCTGPDHALIWQYTSRNLFYTKVELIML